MKVVWVLLTICLSGCGEIAYKRGAGSDELAQAKKNCQKQTQADAYTQCMQTQGWQIHKLDEQSPLAIVVLDTDNRSAGDVYVPTNALPNTPANGKAEAPSPADKNSPPDPLTKFKVSSWWKMGGNGEDLKTDTARCVAQLGSAHAPDTVKGEMTRGLILCLKERGWYGLQAY